MGNGVAKLKHLNYDAKILKNSDADLFLSEISKTLTFDEAFAKLPRAIFYLSQYTKFDSMDVHKLLFFVRYYSGPLKTTSTDQRRRWVDRLLTENVLSFCIRFWRSTFAERIFTKRGENEMRNFRMMMGILWNTTEISMPCCANLCENDGVHLLLDTMNADSLSNSKLERDKSNVNRIYVAHASGVILKQVLHLYDGAKQFFRQADGLKICQKLMTFNSDLIKCTSAMILAYGVEEDEYHMIMSCDDLLRYLIKLLKECADKRAGSIFTAVDLLDAINKLAANDENKLNLVKLGILEPLSKLIQQHSLNDDELNYVLKCIWILSFRQENRPFINQNSAIMKNLEVFSLSDDAEIVKKSKGALWILKDMPPATCDTVQQDEHGSERAAASDEEISLADDDFLDELGGPIASAYGPVGPPAIPMQRRSRASSPNLDIVKKTEKIVNRSLSKKKKETVKKDKLEPSTTKTVDASKTTKHIMISYQWMYKTIVLRIADALKSAGHKVWVDVDQMTGSTLEAMAEAVENAWIVLICLSESYKQSPSCRTEAEYTYKTRKDFIPLQLEDHYKPTGWLGILIGTKLYFNMSSDEYVSNNLSSLLREISNRTSSSGTSDNLSHSIQNGGNLAMPHVANSETDSKFANWTINDVQTWLKDNEMLEISSNFIRFDGALLSGLRKIYFKAPLIYYSTLKNDLNIKDLHFLIKFTNNLENL